MIDKDELIRQVQALGNKQKSAFLNKDYKTSQKNDNSYVTDIDHYSHRFLTELLTDYGFPVISEEDESTWQTADSYWVIDPLDGTREFINSIEEFTINIAFISAQRPIFGIVHHPMTATTYWSEDIAYKVVGGQTTRLECHNKPGPLRILLSRFHSKNPPELDFEHTFIRCGSSLKFPWIAENKADVYPRRLNMYQWDTAAGVAIVRGAGGVVLNAHGEDLVYGANIFTESFVAATNRGKALKVLKFLAG